MLLRKEKETQSRNGEVLQVRSCISGTCPLVAEEAPLCLVSFPGGIPCPLWALGSPQSSQAHECCLYTTFSACNTLADWILSCPSKLAQIALPSEGPPDTNLPLSPHSHYTSCLHPLQHSAPTKFHLFICLSSPLRCLISTNHSAWFLAQNRQWMLEGWINGGVWW